MPKVRWGIIGTGSIANAFAHSIQHCEYSSLVSVYGRNNSTLEQFSSKFKIDCYNDIDLFISSEAIDAVYIATPHSSHFEYVIEAIKHKKHILCEKPITINHLESMVLFGLAKDAGIFLMEAYMYRTHPQTLNIIENLDIFKNSKNKILINSSFGFCAEISKEHRLRNPMLGGGAILDVGCYPLSMSKLLAGKILNEPYAAPKSIKATGQIDETGVDLQSHAHLIFDKYIEANISCAINEEFSNSLEIISGNLRLIASQPWHCGQFQDGDSSIQIFKDDILYNEIFYKDEIGLFTREIDHASKNIIDGRCESELISHSDSQSIMLWLDKWREELDIQCPYGSPSISPIVKSNFYKNQTRKLDKIVFDGKSKSYSRLVLGCDNQTSELHAFTMFDYFYGAGGRIFDTAYIYNNGYGDRYLGNWINSRNLSDKVTVLGKGAHTPDCEPKFIKPQIEESLDRLNLNKIDIYCLHRDNKDIPAAEFIDALDEIRSEGLIESIGASNWELERFSDARDYALKNNKEPFSVLSNNYSLAEMMRPVWDGCIGMNDDYLEYVFNNKIKLFPWSSTARGFFIKKKEVATNDHFSNPSLEEEKRVWHSDKNLQRRESCFQIAKERNIQPIEVALSYVIQKSSLIFPLIGPRTVNELDSSIFASTIHLNADEIKRLSRE